MLNFNLNKGMFLEDLINKANEYYLVNNKAIIHKKPTPISILSTKKTIDNNLVITKAVFSKNTKGKTRKEKKKSNLTIGRKESKRKKRSNPKILTQHFRLTLNLGSTRTKTKINK